MVRDIADHAPTPIVATPEPDRRSFQKWTGWSGLLGTMAFIVTIVMSTGGVSGPEGPGDMSRFLDDVSSGGWLEYVYGVAGIALVVLYIPMAYGINRLLGTSTSAWFGSAAVVFGLAVLLPAYLINILPPAAFVPVVDQMGEASSEALYADYSVVRSAAELFFTVGSVLSLGFGPLLWGTSWISSRRDSQWLGWAGVVTGLTGMVWFVWLVDGAFLGVLLIVNVLVSLVFFAGASVKLVMESRAT